MGAAMATTDVKNVLGITSTTYDTQISALLYPSASFANEWCNGGLSRDLYHRDGVYVTLGTSTAAVTVTNSTVSGSTFQWLVGPVIVYSSDEAKMYEEDRDYEIDYENGTIVPLAGSTYGTSTGGDVLVDFSYIDLTGARKGAQVAVAQMIWQDINSPVGVVSESAGPLSRSYSQDGLNPTVQRLLRPFRRVFFK